MTEPYVKKQQRFWRLKTIDMLQTICGYTVNKPITPEVGNIFDFSCDSPFSKDEGELVKLIVFDFIDESKLQAIREFKTSKKKSLWIWFHPKEGRIKVYVFKFEGESLVYPRNEAILIKFGYAGLNLFGY